jgi:hypothetical protein
MKGFRTIRWSAALVSAALIASLTACQRDAGAGAEPSVRAGQKASETGGGIDPSRVCFINNKYMGAPQIPVVVDDKTYYGCCQGCVTALRSDPSSRVAKDPYSGARVDKAMAFIARNPADPDTVLYFESAMTFAAYSHDLR